MQEDEIVPVNQVMTSRSCPGSQLVPSRLVSMCFSERKRRVIYLTFSRSYLTRASCFCLEEDRVLSYIVFALRTKFAELKLVKGKKFVENSIHLQGKMI